MFTGIVTELGSISHRHDGDVTRFTIVAPGTTEGLAVGDSIAVNGACLTAVTVTGPEFTVEAVAETLGRSNLGDLQPGDRVDLERPMPASGRFDGHIVQGHVDGVGEVLDLATEGSSLRMRVQLPEGLVTYVVEKGSITVDGVSLTVTAAATANGGEGWFEVVLIPHTLATTILSSRETGDRVNLEVDILAKYVARMLETRR